jgi:hypothetical protein
MKLKAKRVSHSFMKICYNCPIPFENIQQPKWNVSPMHCTCVQALVSVAIDYLDPLFSVDMANMFQNCYLYPNFITL